jgi:TM2 domain-containing membrane protein YozV
MMMMAYLLWWFGPAFGAHRFYLGAYQSGAAMAGLFWDGLARGAIMSKKSSLWVGGYAVPPFWAAMILAWLLWCLIDAFLIPGMMRRHRENRRSDGLAHVFA